MVRTFVSAGECILTDTQYCVCSSKWVLCQVGVVQSVSVVPGGCCAKWVLCQVGVVPGGCCAQCEHCAKWVLCPV